ncbi:MULTISPECIES: hypothetical protein [Streptomyces]|uniref:Uncharacterized protein n=1 Tax=Streptomyces lonegramiae TaxID=3075524 RepID=A0ABU2XI22_9ACTN|nr:hypothetical protein [Streptomyces sp. DSM 41529]MDT0545569.1 hypothetical protein [Streptomyces sp. DSM 41529]
MSGTAVVGRTSGWVRMLRAPWTVACVAATVLLGSSATVASALDRANAAPGHRTAVAAAPSAAATAETGGRFTAVPARWRP